MRVRPLLLGAVLLTTGLAGCMTGSSQELVPNPVEPCGRLDPSFQVDEGYNPRVQFQTSNGTFTIVTYLEQVPVTAGNFLDLVRSDFYDGTRFHRLVPPAFIQGGDPRSSQPNKRLWGTGGPGYSIPDEFHMFLRHDEAGMVSMAQAKPNSAGSQFLITLKPLPSLNDRNAIFGEVVQGMQTVREIAQTPTDSQGRPEFEAKLHDARILPPTKDPRKAGVHLTAYGYDCVQATEPGEKAEFLLAVRNTGQRVLNGTWEADLDELPGNWSADIRNTNTVAIPSGQTIGYVFDVNVSEEATSGSSYSFNVTFADKDSNETITRELTVNVGPLGAEPKRGDTVAIRYVGILEDGRPFDTTVPAYTQADTLRWFKPPPSNTTPIKVTFGQSGLIEGMSSMIDRARYGESVVEAVSPSKAYGANSFGKSNLGGRLLLFQIDVLRPSSVHNAQQSPSVGAGPAGSGPGGGA